MMRYGFCLTLLTIALAGCTRANTLVPDDALVVWHGTVIDATGKSPIRDGIVVIRGPRITAVGAAADFVVPQGVRIVDAGGGTIMPGIINSHTHGTGNPAIRREFLVDGVTSVCNVGVSLDGLSAFEQAAVPEGPAARAFWAGPILTAPGGYPGPVYGAQFGYEVGTPEDGRKAVADLLDRGASMIKIALAPGDPRDPWPVLDLERVRSVVEEAHRRGVLVRAHVFEPYIVADIVLPAGVDVIEHSPFPILSEEEERSVLESPIPRAQLFDVVALEFEGLLARVAEHNVVDGADPGRASRESLQEARSFAHRADCHRRTCRSCEPLSCRGWCRGARERLRCRSRQQVGYAVDGDEPANGSRSQSDGGH